MPVAATSATATKVVATADGFAVQKSAAPGRQHMIYLNQNEVLTYSSQTHMHAQCTMLISKPTNCKIKKALEKNRANATRFCTRGVHCPTSSFAAVCCGSG